MNGLTFDATLDRWFTAEGYRDWTGTLDPLPVFSAEDAASWSQTGSIPLPSDFAPDGTVAESVEVGRILRIGSVLYLSGWHSRGLDYNRALAWTSVDGSRWVPIATDLPPEAGVVASNGDVLVAQTSLFTFAGTRLWRSTDGTSWTEAVLPTSDPLLLDVFGDDDGFVAVGSTMTRDAEDRTFVMWRSLDGMTWTPMTLPAELTAMGDVARFPDGRYLISGSDQPMTADADRVVRLWVSDDGASWTSAAEFTHAGSAAAVGASSSGAIYLGVHEGFLRAWASADGVTWQELPAAQPVPEVIRTGHVTDLVFVQSLVVTDERWVGMGQGNEDYRTDLWVELITP